VRSKKKFKTRSEGRNGRRFKITVSFKCKCKWNRNVTTKEDIRELNKNNIPSAPPEYSE
jgi:hypothetical protein